MKGGLASLSLRELAGRTSQQISNDPGGDRWARLLDDSIDMFLDHVGALPGP